MRNIRVIGTGSYLPEKVLSNKDLEKLMDTSDDWIYSTYGIRERRIVADHQNVSDLSIASGKSAIENAGIDPESIDVIIHASINNDYRAPATACIVQGDLGCNNAFAFDMNLGGCPNAAFAIATAAKYLDGEQYKRALVIGTEVYSKFINWSHRDTSCFLGDGSGAIVLEWNGREKPAAQALHTDGRFFREAIWPGAGTVVVDKSFETPLINGRAVWNFGHTMIPDIISEVSQLASIPVHKIDFFVFHQANARMIHDILEITGIPKEKTYINNYKYGNTGGASSLIALDEAHRCGLISNNDSVLLCSYGAGLAWGAVILNFDTADYGSIGS